MKTRKYRPGLGLLPAVLLVCGGCGDSDDGGNGGAKACTVMACDTGFSLAIKSASSPWKTGVYKLEVQSDGSKTTCTATLPLSSVGSPGSECSSPTIMLGVSGSALPANQQALTSLRIEAQPASVSVTVFLDDKQIAQQSYTPTYKKLVPNGEGCPPVCYQADDTISIP